MANWCNNNLTITGDKEQIAEFKAKTFIENKILATEEEINKFHAEHIVNETPKKYLADIKNYMIVQQMTPLEYITSVHHYEKLQGEKEENEDLQEIQGYIKRGTHLDFGGTLPCPTELDADDLHTWGGINASEQDRKREKMTKKYGYNNAYDWHCANWGTKWNAMYPDLYNESETELNYNFSTAWSPPCAWLRETAPLFPKLCFEINYREDGMGFMGTAIAEGDSFSDDTQQIPQCPKCGYLLSEGGYCENDECEECEDYKPPTEQSTEEK